MSEFVKFELRSAEDRSRMQEALTAQFRCERLGMARRAAATLATTMALPLWIEVGWPGLLSRRAVGIVFALFAVLWILLVAMMVREYTWHRRSERARERRDQRDEH
jgi:hypothetical protein